MRVLNSCITTQARIMCSNIRGTIERYKKATADASSTCSTQEINAQVSDQLSDITWNVIFYGFSIITFVSRKSTSTSLRHVNILLFSLII